MIRKQHGFTIVELLIVIVVIGILAGMSIVAYNGIQKRAQSTAWASAVNDWTKILLSHKAMSGTFPSTGAYEACLSRDVPAVDGFAANQCYYSSGGYNINNWASVNTELTTSFTTIPAANLPIVHTTDNANGNKGHAHGLVYAYTGSGQAYIQYYLADSYADGGCLAGDSVEYANYAEDLVRCRRFLQG